MIPADAPPSFDAHRETTFATIHSAAPFYSVLIRVDPNNPSSTTDFVCDLCTAMPQPTDGGKTYTFNIRERRQIPRRVAADGSRRGGELGAYLHPPEGVLSPRESHYVMVDTVEAPDPTTVVFHLKFATSAFLPALADPYSWIYKKEILDKDPRWYEKNILGSGPFKFVDYQVGQSIKGVKNPDYYHKGLPHLDGLPGSMPTSRRCGSMRSAATARRSSSAAFPLRCATSSSARSATRSPCRQRLELRQLHRAQPQEEAIRRCPGAPRADPGDRPLAWRAAARQDRQCAYRRRHRLPRLAVGGGQGGAAGYRRVLARYREVAGRGEAAVEGGRRRGAYL